jgi:general secretion pathway protein B
MSSILDALRKVDEQKSARRRQPLDLTQGVLKGNAVAQGVRFKPWQLALAFFAVAAISILITLLATGPQKRGAQVPTAVNVSPGTPQGKQSPAAPVSPVTTVPLVPATVTPGQPVTLVVAKPLQSIKPVKTGPPSQVTSIAEQVPTARPAFTEEVVATIPEQTPARVQPPTLKVTGIGWQKDAAARYAVINGTAVSEGGIVDGAKVEEILPDKVRLRIDGNPVEISMGK